MCWVLGSGIGLSQQWFHFVNLEGTVPRRGEEQLGCIDNDQHPLIVAELLVNRWKEDLG